MRLQVEGEKVLDDEKETQDFLLINHPVFFVRDAQGFANLTKASVGQANEEELRSLAPTFESAKFAGESKTAYQSQLAAGGNDASKPYQVETNRQRLSLKEELLLATAPTLTILSLMALVEVLSRQRSLARVRYFSYLSVLHLYETLGLWRRADLLKVHFAETCNELHHLLIMESLGGNRHWFDRLTAHLIAVVYYWLVVPLTA